MKIVFHGAVAQGFMPGFEALLDRRHQIGAVDDVPEDSGARQIYSAAEVMIGVRLAPGLPLPPGLLLYQVPGAGYDGLDIGSLKPSTAVCNCFGHETAIAEYVMAALLSRHVPLADADARLRRGDWTYFSGARTGLRSELGGTSIGIVGFGHIGKAIAARAKSFGMSVVVANRTPVAASELVTRWTALTDLPAFMASADAIVVTLSLAEATRGLIGREALSAMRPDAVIINVGRGPVIDEAALYHSLKDRRIGGAIIDTWYVYPTAADPHPQPAHLPFAELDNVVMTSHMSGWTQGTVARRQKLMANNIGCLIDQRPLANVVRAATR